MSTLCSAQVTSRANSDLLTIDRINQDVTLSTPARMALITAITAGWTRATEGSTGHYAAVREAKKREPLLYRVSMGTTK